MPKLLKRRYGALLLGLLLTSFAGACSDVPGESGSSQAEEAGSPSSSAGAEAQPLPEGGAAMAPSSNGGAGGEQLVSPGVESRPVLVDVAQAPSDVRAVNVVFGARAGGQLASRRIGVGIHNYAPSGSNASLYLERLGVNATRVFGAYLLSTTLPKYLGRNFGRDLDGKLIETHSAFNDACKALSSGPEAPGWQTPLPWADIRARMGDVGLLATLDEQVRLELELDLQLSPPSSFDFSTYDTGSAAYWQERWSLYVYYYAEARIALQHGVRTFELINEPDLIEYTGERLLDLTGIASRAVQAAAADLAKPVKLLGPTFGRNGADLDHSEYGPFLADLHERFGAGPNPKWSNVQALAYHRYSGDGALFSSIATTLSAYAQAHTDVALPLWITEFNAYTGAAWDQRADSPDTPAAASRFVAEAVALSDKVEGQIAFLMAMYGSSNKVQKNGIHWVDNSAAPAGNIGGRTRSAAAFALFARNFAGKALWPLNVEGAASGQYAIATADDTRAAALLVNDTARAMDVRLDFSALSLSPDAVAAWQVVDAEHRGDTAVRYALGKPQALSRSVPANAVVLVSVPRGAGPFAHWRYPAAAGVELRAGSLRNVPQGARDVLEIRTDAAGDNAHTSVALLKFSLDGGEGAVEGKAIAQATLQLWVKQAGARECVIHAFGSNNTDWSSSEVTWGNSALLQPLADGQAVNAIARNFVAYQTPVGLAFLGDLNVAAGAASGDSLQLDITDFARAHTAGFTLLLAREFMNDGTTDRNPAADDLSDSWVSVHGGVGTLSEAARQPAVLIERR